MKRGMTDKDLVKRLLKKANSRYQEQSTFLEVPESRRPTVRFEFDKLGNLENVHAYTPQAGEWGDTECGYG